VLISLVATSNGQTSRPFLMSSTAVSVHLDTPGFYDNGPENLPFSAVAPEVDVLTVMAEYLGVPFDEFYFSAEPDPLHPWTIAMRDLAARSMAPGKPIMLQLVLTRDTPVAAAFNNEGQLLVYKSWGPRCMAFDTPLGHVITTAYANYAAWMANLFRPSHLVVFVEMNLYYVHCGGSTASWNALVQAERNAYDAVKSAQPGTAVFPSFKVEDLYAQNVLGFDEAQYAAMSATKRDRFGLAVYPYGIRKPDGRFVTPFEVPIDYLQRTHTRHPSEKRIVVTETGWISQGPSFGTSSQCFGPMPFSAQPYSEIYLEILLYNAYLGNFDMITWWSNRDLLPAQVVGSCFPETVEECADEVWCSAIHTVRTLGFDGDPNFDEFVFKAFSSMGLRDYGGSPKGTLAARWMHFLNLPVSGP
jgi:hypothetical protein